jgi:glycosidase
MDHPLLYEINTRCWLRFLSEEQGREVTLATVPERVFQRWRQLGFTHVWLMGVWTTGPKSRSHALHDPNLRKRYSELLPGWHERDVPGSPYSIADYEVPAGLGGEAGLRSFRAKLNGQGMKLVLDFVPNHAGLDHPWVEAWPELLVQGTRKQRGTFEEKTARGTRWIAHGRDPHFSPWTDTVQLDYRNPATRTAMTQVLKSIAQRCDGVRCDMAMLVLNEVFEKTWAGFPGATAMPREEFWAEAISTIKREQPGFLFLAEAYWGLQSRLQALGFDHTYDKHVYDCVVDQRFGDLQKHLLEATPEYVTRSAHFLENHDERRIASVMSIEWQRAAVLMMLGLPGMRLLYEGQMRGARLQVPVQLGRWPREKADLQVREMYEKFLAVIKESAVGRGEWRILKPQPAWEGNPTAQNFVIVQWWKSAAEFDLVVVNLASHPGQCRVRPETPAPKPHDWEMRDLLGAGTYERDGVGLAREGLHLDLPGDGAQLFRFKPAK